MIADKLDQLSKQIPQDVTLVAVSKTKPQELLMEAYDSGQRIFGENKVQELVDKHEKLPKDIQWHFIGHLQRNKVKYLAPFVDLIHSVESLRLLKEVNKQGIKNNRIINVLLQFHIANEDSKFGLSLEECIQLLESEEYLVMQNVKIQGVMGMATFTKDQEQVRSEFKSLKTIYDELKSSSLSSEDGFSIISMGMSGDYEIAIEEGSNMIRIGSTIFGARN
jgi:pyridoxal phosphate enzyme (YggS family)